jgi:hypothetical protein
MLSSTSAGQASRVFVRQAPAARGGSVQRKRLAAATAEGIETPAAGATLSFWTSYNLELRGGGAVRRRGGAAADEAQDR